MSRKLRVWYTGARFHITARGNRGGDLFWDDVDFEEYLHFVQWCQADIPFVLHAYCLMTNHVHLLLEVRNHSPGDVMQFIQFRYAKYFNRRHKMNGHLFQGRYYSKLIDTKDYFLAASKYIHVNPVKAGICANPESYLWSSYRFYTEKEKSPLVTTSRLLDCFEQPKSLRYQKYVKEEGGEEFGDYCEEYRPEGV